MAILNVTGVLQTGAAPTDGSEPLAPETQPLAWPAGQSGSIALAVVDPLGAPVNITGATLKLAVKRLATDAAPVLEVTGSVTSGAGGLASFPFVTANTSALAVEIYRYDVWISLSGARSQVVPASNFSIRAAELPPADLP